MIICQNSIYMKEIWKDVSGFEGLYQVSNFGRVRSLKFGKEKMMEGGITNKGYLQVTLSLNGRVKRYQVHRLVADVFISNPNNLPQVNHIDGNKTNNNVENLEWVTAKQNIHHAWNAGLHPLKLVSIHCNELDLDFNSINEASRYFGCDNSCIRRILKGKYKSLYKKYTFSYIQ